MPRMAGAHRHRPGDMVEGLVVHSPRDPRAPLDPEYRERRIAAAPLITREAMARQLADDPEFVEWAAAERRAEFAAGRPR